ncbi:MAG: hypothetical protein KGL95_10385, partial [Patescibacteria group bacterium]|nr:hypothetical protein [Patescibacteria group bacterium]
GNNVLYLSDAPNLGVTNGNYQLFVRNRLVGTTEMVSIMPDGSQRVGAATAYQFISGDGRYVAFNGNNNSIAYLRDRTLQTTVQLFPDVLVYMTPDARYFVYRVRS